MDKPVWLYVLVGVIGGTASGLAGIGGGVIMVPLMVGVVAMRQHLAQGTSLVIIIPTAIASGAIYFLLPRGGEPPPLDIIVAYAVPAMVGAPLGALMTRRLNAAQLRRLFGLLLFGVALRLIVPAPVGTVLLALSLVALVVATGIMVWRGVAVEPA